MLWLYRLSVGFLQIEILSGEGETLLNICAKHGITVWGIKRKDSSITLYMTVRDFRALPLYTRGKKIRLHILKRQGFPFIVNRYKNRWGIAVGAALFFAILYTMSQFVWTIEVAGNKTVPSEKIITACEKIGVKSGILRSSVDQKHAKQQLILALDEIAFAAFNIEGSRLTVNVTETKKTEAKDKATNLKAAADGTVTKIDVTSGTCLVRVGQTVAKGDILVSGVVEHKDFTEYVSSKGSVFAETKREIVIEKPFNQTVIKRNGKIKKRSVIDFFGLQIPLYLGKQGGSYETELNKKSALLFGKELPIRLYTKTFFLTDKNKITLNEKELKNRLNKALEDHCKVENFGDFKVEFREFDEKNDKITLKSIISAQENIATEEILLFNTGN